MLEDSIIIGTLFGFTVFSILFSILTRKFSTYPIHIFFSSFIVAFFITIVFSWVIVSNILVVVIIFILYSLFASAYILIYMNFDSSLHLRILREVAEAGSKGLTYKELLLRYNKKIILKKRLLWLINSDEVEMTGNILKPCRRRFSSLLVREKVLVFISKLYGSKKLSS